MPYELPANATQSGTKSRSSKGGTPANFNEIRMEDKKGAEQLPTGQDRTGGITVLQAADLIGQARVSVAIDLGLGIGDHIEQCLGEGHRPFTAVTGVRVP